MTRFLTDCTKYQDDLKAYADGELSWLRRAAVRRHLTHCASCREEIANMTQMTEDLRAAEPGDALPPSLREKLLTAPGTESAGLLLNESRSATEDSAVPEALSLDGRPALPVPVKKRRVPAWTFAAAALVAWFIFYPLYSRNLVEAHHQHRVVTADREAPKFQQAASAPLRYPVPTPPMNMNGAAPLPPARAKEFAPPITFEPTPPPQPAVPPTLTVRLSDREAGIDANGKPQVYISNGPRSLNQTVDGNENALNATNADPDSLRQVHKEASIGIQVPNPEATGDTLNTMVQETGGYVAANNLSTDPNGLKSGELIVKVPEAQFETFLAQVAKLGIVQSKNVTGQDITEKTSDAHEAQAVQESDLEKSEARLKALGSHAKWEDQESTRDLRVQLAQTRARLKLLKRMAALGTLTIDLSQTPRAAAAPPVTNGFTGSLKATTHDALQSLVGSAGALLALVIWLLAYAPIWVPLLLLGRYALKEYRKREAASSKV